MTIEELYNNTLSWSHDRGILTNGKATTQALKLVSEFGELCGNFCRCTDITDDIGDCCVVLTNLTSLTGCDRETVLADIHANTISIETNTDLVVRVGESIGKLCDCIAKGSPAHEIIVETFAHLEDLANGSDLLLEDCWEHSYNEIKDRKGFLNAEGVFIKESDPAYQQLKLNFEGGDNA